LRAVTNLPGFRPSACTDLFDAMDGYPADTSTSRGGDGVLNTLDLIITLQRATNINTTRPRRLSRNLTCTTATPAEAKRRLPNGDAILQLELAADSEQRTAVYLVAAESVDLAGMTFAASGEGIAFIPVSQPSLADTGIANTVALAWLNNFSMRAGQTLLLGYLQSQTTPVVSNAAASAISGESIAVDTPSGSRVRK